MKKIFCCPALELFHCLPLWKTVLFVSSRAFSLSTPAFLFSTPMENSEATWKKATKCNKRSLDHLVSFLQSSPIPRQHNGYFVLLHQPIKIQRGSKHNQTVLSLVEGQKICPAILRLCTRTLEGNQITSTLGLAFKLMYNFDFNLFHNSQ